MAFKRRFGDGAAPFGKRRPAAPEVRVEAKSLAVGGSSGDAAGVPAARFDSGRSGLYLVGSRAITGFADGVSVAARRIEGRPRRGPLWLFSWDVKSPGEGLGPCGVTSDRQRALGHLRRELEAAAQGTRGTVRRVELSLTGQAEYLDRGLVAEAKRTGRGVSWVAQC